MSQLNHALEYLSQTMTDIIALLTTSPQDFRGGGIWPVIQTLHGTMQAVAYALMVLFFCFGIFKTAANVAELKRPEIAFKMFFRFALTKAAISHGMELLLAVLRLAQGMLSSAAGSLKDLSALASVLPQEAISKIGQTGFFESIPVFLVAFIGHLGVIAMCFIMLLTVYGRFFRVYIFTAIAPIPLSSFAGETSSMIGKSFAKAYAGVCVEGLTIVLACVVFSAYTSSSGVTIDPGGSAWDIVSKYVVDLLFNLLVLVSTVRMSERISKEMMGL